MGKTGLVLEGGALRGIFTAGVLDYLMEKNIHFPYVIGVSAGAGNAVNYVAGQIGRSKKVIIHENKKPYYGLSQWFENKKILNLEMLVVEYAMKDFPFDFDAFYASETMCECVAVNCETGKAEYFHNFADKDHLLRCNMASCAVPFACEPIEIDGKLYLDGSIVDSVPVERAMAAGCDQLVVVLTRPEGGQPTDYAKMKHIIEICYEKKYPALCEALVNRKAAYEKQMEHLQKLEQEGKAFIIRPETQTIGHFESDQEKLCQFYETGYQLMGRNYEQLLQFMKDDGK